jgi:Rne/Rng family ribonuclease
LTRVLLLNLADDEERRAALLEDGRLSLLWVERSDEATLVGNVYKGRVTHVERAIGAAFVDIGLDRPGFLHGDDVPAPGDDTAGPSDASSPIQDVLEPGQEIVVQVTRDALAHKGPSLTGNVSIPGRRLVVFPALGRKAVSRKITDEAERKRLEDIVAAAPGATAMGVVVRTAAVGVAAEELHAELAELLATHAALMDEAEKARGPSLLRADADFVVRAVRELLARSIGGAVGPARVVVDTEDGRRRVETALAGSAEQPRIDLHEGPTPLFHAHGVEREVRALDEPRVPLPGGAALVIHETEALWAIDVNSGRMRDAESLEETALAVDLVAAAEAARQIRLRDLGGLVVVDFIDCVDPENRAKVEAKFREELARDPARMRVAPLSEFMVSEITRRRMRSGPAHAGSATCPSCRGRGRTRSPRSAGLAALRELRAVLAAGAPHGVEIACAPAVADDLEARLPSLRRLEETHDVPVHVDVDDSMAYDRFEVRKLAPTRRGKV